VNALHFTLVLLPMSAIADVCRVIGGICDFVCLSAWAINTKNVLYDGRSACIYLDIKRSAVKVAGLWSVLQMLVWCPLHSTYRAGHLSHSAKAT